MEVGSAALVQGAALLLAAFLMGLQDWGALVSLPRVRSRQGRQHVALHHLDQTSCREQHGLQTPG